MGGSTPLIVSLTTPAYGRVVVDASDGRRYHADLAPVFSAVHCYPKTKEAWASDRRARIWIPATIVIGTEARSPVRA
jgi:hypothetical protein